MDLSEEVGSIDRGHWNRLHNSLDYRQRIPYNLGLRIIPLVVVVLMKRTILHAFRGPEGWYIARGEDDPIGPYKSPEQCLERYCIGKRLDRFEMVIKGQGHGKPENQGKRGSARES